MKAYSAPPDSSDEPAAVLLERLCRQRSHPAAKRTPRRSWAQQLKLR